MTMPKPACRSEFKEVSVKRVRNGQSISTVKVTPEEMVLSGLRAENLRLKRENEILKKETAHFAGDVL